VTEILNIVHYLDPGAGYSSIFRLKSKGESYSDSPVTKTWGKLLDTKQNVDHILIYKSGSRRNLPFFGAAFLSLNYTDITKHTYYLKLKVDGVKW